MEDVKRESKKRQPVAGYVDEDDAEWLQHHRVELNAMSSPQLLEWLDSKMTDYGEKLVPPDEVLASQLENDVRSVLERRLPNRFSDRPTSMSGSRRNTASARNSSSRRWRRSRSVRARS